MDKIKKTPLYEEHVKHKANMVPFAGFEMPIVYSGMIDEHMAVRDRAGLFDVSHMGEILIEGKDAISFTDYLITNEMKSAQPGDIKYSAMLYEDGGEVDDLLAYYVQEDKILLVVNASNIDKDFAHILAIKKTRPDLTCTVSNISDEWGQVAFQGPLAEDILQKLTTYDLSQLKCFTFTSTSLAGIPTTVSRTGYTGEDGFEILAKENDIVTVWNAILKAGEKDGVIPCGLGSRDTLRFEAFLWLYGNDIDHTTNPIEAGQTFAVKLGKDFVGKKICLEEKEKGPKRKLVGFEVEGKMIPRHRYPIFLNQKEVGYVTSGNYCPKIQKVCAIGYIPANQSDIGTEFSIRVRNKDVSASITKKPFYKGTSGRKDRR